MKEFGNKLLAGFVKFVNFKAIVALKDGFVMTMPATIIGSICLLVANLPIPGYADWLNAHMTANWNIGLNQINGATFNILAIIVAVGIGYAYAANEGMDGISSGLLSLVAFMILSPQSMTTTITGDQIKSLGKKTADVTVSGLFPQNYTGSQGVITAIISGLLVGLVFTACVRHNLRIKMPEAVPEGVSNAFSALIPGTFVILGSGIIYHIAKATTGKSVTELIFTWFQTPLQGLTDNWGGAIAVAILMPLIFWTGVHGANVVSGIITPILTVNSLDNQKLIDAHQALTRANGAHYFTPQVIDLFVKYGGVGLTLGLITAVFMFGKSKQMREVAKLGLVPGIFNINEPIIFGLPIMYDPFMLIPFIVAPVIAMILTYGAISVGIIAPFGAVQIPWTTPPIISGFLIAGWKGIVLQLIIFVESVLVYMPFVKARDKMYLAQEQGEAAGESASDEEAAEVKAVEA